MRHHPIAHGFFCIINDIKQEWLAVFGEMKQKPNYFAGIIIFKHNYLP